MTPIVGGSAPMLTTPTAGCSASPAPWCSRVSGLVARLPISMVSLGIVLLVSTRTGSYGWPGAVSAAYLVANALVRGPPGAAHRPARPAPGAAGGRRRLRGRPGRDDGGRRDGLAAPWPHLFAAWPGPAMPQIGSSVRARWSLPGRPDKQRAAHRLRLRGGRRRDGLHRRPGPGDRAGHHRAPAGRARVALVAAVAGTARPGRPATHGAARRPGRPDDRAAPPMPWPCWPR